MLNTLAVENYRSLQKLIIPLGQLNVITGANGSGKSNLYRALRLLADTAQGGVTNSLAQEGGLASTFWSGPEVISSRMRSGEIAIQGGPRKKTVRLKLGFAGDQFGYSISMGLPTPASTAISSAFNLDPEIKKECIWAGSMYRSSSLLVDRTGALIRVRSNKNWDVISESISVFESIFSSIADPQRTPEVMLMRENIRGWRFYDHFRTDKDAPARLSQLGSRTPVLSHDGKDLAAAIQTIYEIGDQQALSNAVSDAFPGATVCVNSKNDGRFSLQFNQPGLLRPFSASELSDGTLRYLLWVAALLTPRPPSMMILNEPETSLHPDLLPALAKLILHASEKTQIWVVSHADLLISKLKKHRNCNSIELQKELGQTQIVGQGLVDRPSWHWPDS